MFNLLTNYKHENRLDAKFWVLTRILPKPVQKAEKQDRQYPTKVGIGFDAYFNEDAYKLGVAPVTPVTLWVDNATANDSPKTLFEKGIAAAKLEGFEYTIQEWLAL